LFAVEALVPVSQTDATKARAMPIKVVFDEHRAFEGVATPSPALIVRFHLSWEPPKNYTRAVLLHVHGMAPRVSLTSGAASVTLPARVNQFTAPVLHADGLASVEVVVDLPWPFLEDFQRLRGDAAAVTMVLDPVITASTLVQSQLSNEAYLSTLPTTTLGDVWAKTELSRDRWAALLDRVGYADVIVFELQTLKVGSPPIPRITKARECLALATRAFHERQTGYEATVADHIYRAMQALAADDPSMIADTIVKTYFSGAHEEIKTRMQKMLIPLLGTYHVARKVAPDPGLDVSREHAAWILGTAQLLVAWCAGQARVLPA
jgi:hypothetical protein